MDLPGQGRKHMPDAPVLFPILQNGLRVAAEAGLDSRRFLSSFDAFHFFDPVGRCIRPGPTGTNVMDLYVSLT